MSVNDVSSGNLDMQVNCMGSNSHHTRIMFASVTYQNNGPAGSMELISEFHALKHNNQKQGQGLQKLSKFITRSRMTIQISLGRHQFLSYTLLLRIFLNGKRVAYVVDQLYLGYFYHKTLQKIIYHLFLSSKEAVQL